MIKEIALTAYPSNNVAGTRAWCEEKLALIHEGPVCKQTSFSDPEGNKVSIHQKTAPR